MKRLSLARKAAALWDKNEHEDLVRLAASASGARDADVLYFAGLAHSALNQRRETIECWRKASELRPDDERTIRALATELVDDDPVNASELLSRLAARNQANADDLTTLAEIRIKQDRLGEAQKLLQKALELEQDNSLALLAMASLYASVRDRDMALEYLERLADTGDMDLSDLRDAPEFEFLWHDARFEKVSQRQAKSI